MNELLSVLLEETNESLISNSQYNIEKSNLFRLLKERESTIEMLWQKTKEDAHKLFLNKKRQVEQQILALKSSTYNSLFIIEKVEDLKHSLDLAKNTYKETIRKGATEYQTNYDKLLKRFESDLENLRSNILNPIKKKEVEPTELESQLIETFNKRKDRLEQHFNDKWSMFKGKINRYKELVSSFKKSKFEFDQQVKKTKIILQKKQNELLDRENKIIALHSTLKNKERIMESKEEELESKKIQMIRNLDAERAELDSERERILQELESQRTEIDNEFIKVERMKSEANDILTSTQDKFRKAAFWDNFKTNTDKLKSKMEEERLKRYNRNTNSLIGVAEVFFQLSDEYTFDDLRKKYRIKLHEYHPDKHYNKSLDEIKNMQRLFQKTQEMYNVLKTEFETIL